MRGCRVRSTEVPRKSAKTPFLMTSLHRQKCVWPELFYCHVCHCSLCVISYKATIRWPKKMFLRLFKAGWYVITKGRILFRTFSFCCKADFCSENLTSGIIFFNEILGVASSTMSHFEVSDTAIE